MCSIERVISKDEKSDVVSNAYPIAGELKEKGGGYSDVKWTRLKTSEPDAGKEGVRLDIQGGFRKVEGKTRPQKAVVDFICDPSLEGLEDLWVPEEQYDDDEHIKRAEEETKPKEPSLQFVSYDTSGKDEDVLNLLWKTRYACESTKKEEDAERKSHWGFFTWFIIMYVYLSNLTRCSSLAKQY